MNKISKLASACILSVVLMISSVMPVFAAQTTVTASASGPTLAYTTIDVDKECHLYGSASCEEGTLAGNPCYWKARQYGELALAGTNTAASFGSDGEYDNIMSKSNMVTSGALLNYYEKSASAFTYYVKANTRLYY